MNRRAEDSGVVLVNVLVVLAIAGGMLLLFINNQDAALDRISRAADASVVEQIALGAEASVVDALRRDLDDAPDADHFAEDWALGVIQDEVLLPTGRFSVAVTDLQAKYDINQLAELTLGTQEFARRLMIALELPVETADQIARILAVVKRVGALDDLAVYGVSEQAIAALSPHVTALPIPGAVNLNTVDPFLLRVMLQNRGQASQLIRIRDRRGHLTLQALQDVGALRPQNSGFTSNAYRVEVLAETGAARIEMHTTVVRQNARGVKGVAILERRFIHDTPIADTETEN